MTIYIQFVVLHLFKNIESVISQVIPEMCWNLIEKGIQR